MSLSIFGRVGSIKGESRDARHRDEIDVLSWTWGVSHAAAGGGGLGGSRAGRPTFQDFTFTHDVDKASPLLLRACATGEHHRDATFTVRRDGAGQQEYLIVTLTDVQVTSVSMSVDAEAGDTSEVVVLTFGKVDLEYKPQKADGSLEAGLHFTHDLKARS